MDISIQIESNIVTIRNQLAMVDSDVALVYGVATRDINKAVKNNPEKFPDGYIFKLSKAEKMELVENFHRFSNLKHSTVLPKAFTEKGLYMIATILKSHKATRKTIAIIEAFAKLRELGRNVRQLSSWNESLENKPILEKSGELINELLEDDLTISETESTIEINFAVIKLKHTIKREKK